MRQVGHASWSVQALLRYGIPEDTFYYNGGIGDDLLMTAVFHERRKRGGPPSVMMTPYPELFSNNPDVKKILPQEPRLLELAKFFRRNTKYPCYMYESIKEADCHYCPPYPMLARMCKLCGIVGPVDIRPYLYLTDDEKRGGKIAPRQVAIMSSGMSALHKHFNKQWFPERYQAVVDTLKSQYDFVQIGHESDPLLKGAHDLRGKTSIRQTAAVLSQSLAFVGQIGFLMHLARAVDCRAVIVYGGRETPYQSGYSCNENLYTPLPCAPCWRCNTCDFDHECMRRIEPQHVINALERQVGKLGTSLPVDIYTTLPD